MDLGELLVLGQQSVNLNSAPSSRALRASRGRARSRGVLRRTGPGSSSRGARVPKREFPWERPDRGRYSRTAVFPARPSRSRYVRPREELLSAAVRQDWQHFGVVLEQRSYTDAIF